MKKTSGGQSGSKDTSLEAAFAGYAEDLGDYVGVGSLDTGVGKQNLGGVGTSRGP